MFHSLMAHHMCLKSKALSNSSTFSLSSLYPSTPGETSLAKIEPLTTFLVPHPHVQHMCKPLPPPVPPPPPPILHTCLCFIYQGPLAAHGRSVSFVSDALQIDGCGDFPLVNEASLMVRKYILSLDAF